MAIEDDRQDDQQITQPQDVAEHPDNATHNVDTDKLDDSAAKPIARDGTTAPSFHTFSSIDSGIGDEDQTVSTQSYHTADGGQQYQPVPPQAYVAAINDQLSPTGLVQTNGSPQRHGDQQAPEQQQQQQPRSVELELAEEQELVPDVRRIPRRHRRRRRCSVLSHKYVFDRNSTATRPLGATRA